MKIPFFKLLDDWNSRLEASKQDNSDVLCNLCLDLSKIDFLLLKKEDQSIFSNCLINLLTNDFLTRDGFDIISQSFESTFLKNNYLLENHIFYIRNESVITKECLRPWTTFISYFGYLFSKEELIELEKSLFLSGGAIPALICQNIRGSNDLIIKDYDFYFKNIHQASFLITKLLTVFKPTKKDRTQLLDLSSDQNNKLSVVHKNEVSLKIDEINNLYINGLFNLTKNNQCIEGGLSQNAITLNIPGIKPIQFIFKLIGSPEKVTSDFDFYHSQHFFDINDNKITYNPVGLKSIRSKFLKFNKNANRPLGSLIRLTNYLHGNSWLIGKTELIKIVLSIQKFNVFNKEFILDNLNGIYHEAFYDKFEKIKDKSDLSLEEIMEIADSFDLLDFGVNSNQAY